MTFLDELISTQFEKLGSDFRKNLRVGQICRAPVLYCYESSEIWRPCGLDMSGTMATYFNPISQPGDAYKTTNILAKPRLEAYEEFPVVRAKFRPVILLVPSPAPSDIPKLPGGSPIDRHLCLVAPCYSVQDPAGKPRFPQKFLENVRRLLYPHFLFLVNQQPCLPNDSILRLDTIQHVFHNHLQPTEWRLPPDLLKILLGQLAFLFSNIYEGEFKVARNLLLSQT